MVAFASQVTRPSSALPARSLSECLPLAMGRRWPGPRVTPRSSGAERICPCSTDAPQINRTNTSLQGRGRASQSCISGAHRAVAHGFYSARGVASLSSQSQRHPLTTDTGDADQRPPGAGLERGAGGEDFATGQRVDSCARPRNHSRPRGVVGARAHVRAAQGENGQYA